MIPTDMQKAKRLIGLDIYETQSSQEWAICVTLICRFCKTAEPTWPISSKSNNHVHYTERLLGYTLLLDFSLQVWEQPKREFRPQTCV